MCGIGKRIIQCVMLSMGIIILNVNKKVNAQGYCPSTCLTSTILLNTGYDHAANAGVGAVYPVNTKDEYWIVTDAPGSYPVPNCAITWDGNSFDAGSHLGRSVSIVNEGTAVLTNANALCNLKSGSDYYTFRRNIRVCLPTGGPMFVNAILSIKYQGDDQVNEVRFNGIPLSSSSTPGCNGNANTKTWVVPVYHGISYIDMDILNRELFSGTTSPMKLQVTGTIQSQSGASIFIDNNHFGKTDSNCILLQPNLPPEPTFSNLCFPVGVSNDSIFITNYDSANIYHVYTAGLSGYFSIDENGFLGWVGATYTIEVYDKFGCHIGVKVIQPTNPPLLSLSTNKKCLDPGDFATVTATVTGATPPYTYSINGSAFVSSPVFNGLSPNQYTVMVKDKKGCIAQKTITIGNKFTTDLLATPVCVLSGASSVLNASTYSFPVTCNFYKAGFLIPSSGNSVTVSSLGYYEVLVTDAAGCSATSSVFIKEAASLSLIVSQCLSPGKFEITAIASGTTSPFQYQVNGGPLQFSNIFTVFTPGNYTLSVTNSNGCVTDKEIITPPMTTVCCNPILFSTASAGAQYFHNVSSSTIGTPLTGGGTEFNTITSDIVIDGVFTIDNYFRIFQCPNIRFGAEAQVVLANGATLSIENSQLRAACNVMWKGIKANHISQTIQISKNSVLRDMRIGIEIHGNVVFEAPMLKCEASSFIDNLQSITFQNTPANYSGNVWSCKFETSTSPALMLAPYTKMRRAISIFNCKGLEIGGLYGSTTILGNKFKYVENGIYVEGNNSLSVLQMNIRLYNNVFEKIQGGKEIHDGNMTITNNVFTNDKGCAIFAKNTSKFLYKANIHLWIDYLNPPFGIQFADCSKAIVTSNVHVDCKNAIMEKVNAGCINTLADNRSYQFVNNVIAGTLYGIAVTGNANSVKIEENNIATSSILQGLLGDPFNYFHPSAIAIRRVSHAFKAPLQIQNNKINITSQAGTGIEVFNCGSFTTIFKNKIQYNGSYTSTLGYSGQPVFNGIQCTNSRNIVVYENSIIGNATSMQYYGNHAAIRLHKSKDLRLTCNSFQKTKFGMMIEGDCATSPNSVAGNLFNTHWHGMYFRFAGSEGTLGSSIGTPATASAPAFDPRNVFYGTSYVGGHRLYKWSNCVVPSSENYYTSLLILQNIHSSGNNSSCKYFINNNSNSPNTTGCNSLFANYITQSQESYLDLEMATLILQGGSNYSIFEEAKRWSDKNYLFHKLKNHPELQTNIAMQDFVNKEESGAIGQFYKAENTILSIMHESINTYESWAEKISSTKELNIAINTNVEAGNAEKWVNKMYLDILDMGIDSISNEEDSIVKELAFNCPFEFENATYKARTLYDYYHPNFQYNNNENCMKGIIGKQELEQDFESFYLDSIGRNQLVNDNSVIIYPNPSTDMITVLYSGIEEGIVTFEIFDMVGALKQSYILQGLNGIYNCSTSNLGTGIYNYRFSMNGHLRKSGKWVKQN